MNPALTPDAGRLLAATPDMADPNFDGTVILLLEHGPEGTLGVVLNRPSPVTVAEAMSTGPSGPGTPWQGIAAEPDVVFVGGPVQPQAIIALARASHVVEESRWEPVYDDVGVVSMSEGPVTEIGTLDALRIFVGYSGWAGGQLAGEIAAGAWFVVDAEATDGFRPDPEALWRDVLRRQGGLLTTATDNPALN